MKWFLNLQVFWIATCIKIAGPAVWKQDLTNNFGRNTWFVLTLKVNLKLWWYVIKKLEIKIKKKLMIIGFLFYVSFKLQAFLTFFFGSIYLILTYFIWSRSAAMAHPHSLVTLKMKRRQRKQLMMMGGFTQEILDSGYQYVTWIAY